MENDYIDVTIQLEPWMVEWIKERGVPRDTFVRLAIKSYMKLIKRQRL
jgi:hypothetical protein